MAEEFSQNEKKSDDSECDLHTFPPQPLARNRLLPPL